MIASARSLKSIDVSFDDQNLVANSGLLLVSTLSQILGLEKLIDDKVSLSGRVVVANPGRKLLTLIHAMTAGANHIDHLHMLRAGSTGSLPYCQRISRIRAGGCYLPTELGWSRL